MRDEGGSDEEKAESSSTRFHPSSLLFQQFVLNPLSRLISLSTPSAETYMGVVMENHFSQITDAQALDQLLARSHEAPVILFKHSTTCPISSRAYQQMSQVKEDVSLVVVQRARDLSSEIASRTGI